jgi:hypothetical protein
VLIVIAAMQGREGKGQPAYRGRGRNGRGGRGMARPPPRNGTVAAIGAYLDLIPGKEVNPGVVTNWVNKFREYVVTVCESSRINLIFGLDATLGDYPELQEPALPNPDCSKFEKKMWEISYSKYIKDKDRLEGDKGKVFGLMLGQMSESFKNRVKETDNGAIAMENQDPRLLLSAILATHLTDNRLGAEHNLYKIEQAFAKYVMEPGDTLQYYHQRFRAYLSGVQEAYVRAQIECPETAYRDLQLALKFTMGLNSSYSAYKQYYEDGLKNWPENLSDALTEASKYKPRGIGSGNPSDMGRANAFTMRGRGRGRGRGRLSGRGRGADARGASSGDYSGTQSEYGTRKGECHTCGEQGHYSFECRAKDTQGGQKMGAGGAQLEPSNHGKGK